MRKGIIITLSVFALVGVAFAVHRHLDRNVAQPSRDLSKMMSVRLITAEALSAHYQQHGRYPASPSELPLQSLRWGDEGSSARDLDSWRYTSGGQSFTMTWTNARGADLFLGGRTGHELFGVRDVDSKSSCGVAIRRCTALMSSKASWQRVLCYEPSPDHFLRLTTAVLNRLCIGTAALQRAIYPETLPAIAKADGLFHSGCRRGDLPCTRRRACEL